MIVKDPCSVKVYQWWLKDGQEEVKHTTINKMTCSMLWNNMNVSILTKFHINKDALWLLVSQVLRFSDHRLAHSVPRLLLASSTGICVSAMDVLPFCLSLINETQKCPLSESSITALASTHPQTPLSSRAGCWQNSTVCGKHSAKRSTFCRF